MLCVDSRAAFQDPGFGARPEGMGGAFVAVADDGNALLYNPAGAAQVKKCQASFAYAKPFTGMDDVGLAMNYSSVLLPVTEGGVLGLGWGSLRSPAYRSDDGSLAAAASLNRWFQGLTPPLAVGVAAHYLHHRYDLDDWTKNDSVFSGGRSEAAVGVDAGVWLKPEPALLPGLSLGMAVRSLNQPDTGLADEDKAYREWLGGAAWRYRRLTLAADVSRRRQKTVWRAGAEWGVLEDGLALRAGANSTAATAGFSWRIRMGRTRLILDYAYAVPFYVEETAGSHRASFGVEF